MKWIYPQRTLMAYIAANDKECIKYLMPYLQPLNGSLPEQRAVAICK